MTTEPRAPVPRATDVSGRRPVRAHRGQPRPLRDVGRALHMLGPGLITGAADDDPSGIGTYSQAGAAFGTGQLWLALYMLPMLIAVQEMCGRIGLVTGKGLAATIRERYPRGMLLAAVGLVAVANTLNIGADLGAMAATARIFAPDLPFVVPLALLALVIVALEVFIPYRHYAAVLKVLTLSLLAYVATGLIVGGNGPAVLLATVVPNIQRSPAFLALVVGVLGTTISPYLFFWQASEEVEEEQLHHWHRSPEHAADLLAHALRLQLRRLRIDTALGMLASEVATWFIIFTTGSVLYARGIRNIATPSQAAVALEPLVHSFPHSGVIAEAIFGLGIMGVGLLGVPVLAGSAAYAVAEALRWREGLWRPAVQARGFYGVIAVATAVGLVLNVLQVNPIAALVYVAVINGVVAVPLLVMILLVANNRAIMGEHTNGWLANGVGILTTLAMGGAAVATVASLWWR